MDDVGLLGDDKHKLECLCWPRCRSTSREDKIAVLLVAHIFVESRRAGRVGCGHKGVVVEIKRGRSAIPLACGRAVTLSEKSKKGGHRALSRAKEGYQEIANYF